jgi:hypothetical protein
VAAVEHAWDEEDTAAQERADAGARFAQRPAMKCSPCHAFTSIVLVAVIAVMSGCGGTSSSTTAALTSPSPTVVTETFNGSVSQNGTAVFNFTVSNSGYSLLAGFTSITPASVTALGMGIGAWDTTTSTCGLNQTQNDVSRTGSTALSGTAGAGSFCIRVYDAGNIPSADVTATFTVQVQHY